MDLFLLNNGIDIAVDEFESEFEFESFNNLHGKHIDDNI